MSTLIPAEHEAAEPPVEPPESRLPTPTGESRSVSRSARLAILACFLLAIALRFPCLSSRPLHHDESIHAFFSLPAEIRQYRYDPKYHGPFLYHANALVYALVGASDWTCRLLPALTGSALVLLALPLARVRGGGPAVAFAFLVAASPSFVYFSRFIRNDIYAAFSYTLFFLSILKLAQGGPNRWIYLASLALVLHFTSKETAYLFAAIVAGYLPLLALFPGLTGIDLPGGSRQEALERLADWCRERRFALAAAALLFFDIWVYLYTARFHHPEDAPAFIHAISYWSEQHSTKRLGGPFLYYVPILAFYEFLILMPIAWLAIRGALAHPADRFCVYWSAASFVLYGWAGEKVPWLVLHTLLPLALLSASGLARAWVWARSRSSRRIPALALFTCLATAWILTSVRASFLYPAPDPSDPLQHSELLSFVQTTTDVPRVVRKILDSARPGQGEENRPSAEPRIVVDGEANWPLAWYLRNENVRWDAKDLPGEATVIVLDPTASETWKLTLEGDYGEVPFKLRGWWVPQWGKATWTDLVRYALTREPFDGTGYQDCVLWLKKGS